MAAIGELVHPEVHHYVQAQALPRGGVPVALAAHSLGPQKEAPSLELALGFTKKGAPFLEFALGFTKIPELAVGVFFGRLVSSLEIVWRLVSSLEIFWRLAFPLEFSWSFHLEI